MSTIDSVGYGAPYATSTSIGSPAGVSQPSAKESTSSGLDTEEKAYIVEQGDTHKPVTYFKPDMNKLNAIRASHNRNMEAFAAMVEALLTKQGKLASFKGVDLSSEEGMLKLKVMIEEGMPVDQETIDAAKAAIAEDGEFGVEKTSERLFQFAVAACGGDKEGYETMKAAIDEGFAQARKAWGGELPEICQQTYEATMQKLEDWKNS